MKPSRWYTVIVGWDEGNNWDLRNGFNPADEDHFPALKLGPLVFLWGREGES